MRGLRWRGLAGVVALAAGLSAPAAAQTGPHLIHGSWVNVREAAQPSARALDQLVTNTPVQVLSRQGAWCQISYGAGKGGIVACNLLGPQPLSLADTTAAPARAFWVAPSPNRLAAYGQSLVPPTALRLEALKKSTQAGDVVRYPAMAEFEAAKRLMKAGVKLDPRLEIARGAPLDIASELRPYRLRPAPIRPSLFRSHESVALVSETDADGLAAVAGSRVSLQPKDLPVGWFSRHNGPEIEGVTGFWDVGTALLILEPPLVLYSVAANGLVGAAAVRQLPFEVGGEGHYCGARYLSTSLPSADAVVSGGNGQGLVAAPVKGFPVLKDGVEVLASFALPRGWDRRSVKIRSQSEAVTLLKTYEGQADAATVQRLQPRLALREIDLDGDGVADLMQLETPVSLGEISVSVVYHRRWFVNINGQWFAAGDWEDQDCT
jgi:hypothetical protein